MIDRVQNVVEIDEKSDDSGQKALSP